MITNFYNEDLANKPINKFVFVLGREEELCYAELLNALNSFCFDFAVYSVSDNLVFINSEDDTIVRVIEKVGGVTKIFKLIDNSNSDISIEMMSYIEQNYANSGKVTFGISSFSNRFDIKRVNRIGLTLKSKFKSKQVSARFIANTDSSVVSSIISATQLSKRNSLEFAIIPAGAKDVLGIMAVSTDPRIWSEIDYGKPAGDKYSGMLPPKLARIMVNLASSNSEAGDGVVVDPFCGSGNVAIEALRLGYDVLASDLSEKAVADTILNLDWLVSKSELLMPDRTNKFNYKVLKIDAVSDSLITTFQPLAKKYKEVVVVTEPYLGEPKKLKSNYNAIAGEYRKVKDLYINFLSNIRRLASGGIKICIVFPLVETYEGKMYSLYQNSVDEIKKIGYTEVQSPIVYGRDYQIVKREIVVLKISN